MSSALLGWTYCNSSPNSSKVLHAKKGLVIIYIASAGLLKEKTAAGRQGGGGWGGCGMVFVVGAVVLVKEQ